jgi:hypothetical protein
VKHDLPVARRLPVHTLRRLSAALTISALAASGALAAAPAEAGSVSTTARSVVCKAPAQRPTKWREGADTTSVSRAVRTSVQRVVRSATTGTTARTSALPAHVRVPVVIHVIHGRHRGEHRINKRKARRMFRTLKAGYAGAQNPAVMAPTGDRFKLRRVTTSRNDAWFHAEPFSRADRQMKKRLHQGRARTLNIYVNRPKARGQLLLGFSLFPWQRRGHKALDGVTISEVSLPGGRARNYNLGDTVIHETGHWFGLLHTFEGSPDGCVGSGDGVDDTPAEKSASYYCTETNSCIAPVPDPTGALVDQPDPIHNFMDYSYDYCMNHFTPKQRERMIALFVHYRAGR